MTILSMEQFINVFGRHPVTVYLEDPAFYFAKDINFSDEFMDHVMILSETFCVLFKENCYQ